jgi:hypothetical protein
MEDLALPLKNQALYPLDPPIKCLKRRLEFQAPAWCVPGERPAMTLPRSITAITDHVEVSAPEPPVAGSAWIQAATQCWGVRGHSVNPGFHRLPAFPRLVARGLLGSRLVALRSSSRLGRRDCDLARKGHREARMGRFPCQLEGGVPLRSQALASSRLGCCRHPACLYGPDLRRRRGRSWGGGRLRWCGDHPPIPRAPRTLDA